MTREFASKYIASRYIRSIQDRAQIYPGGVEAGGGHLGCAGRVQLLHLRLAFTQFREALDLEHVGSLFRVQLKVLHLQYTILKYSTCSTQYLSTRLEFHSSKILHLEVEKTRYFKKNILSVVQTSQYWSTRSVVQNLWVQFSGLALWIDTYRIVQYTIGRTQLKFHELVIPD